MDLSHIGIIEYEEHNGPYRWPKIALFNNTKFKADEAFAQIRSGEYSDNIVIMEKRQWVELFKNGKEASK